MTKRSIEIIVALFFAVLVSLSLYLYQSSNRPTPQPILQENQAQQNDQNIVGRDKDEHGCIGSAGYSWCESSNKCVRTFEELCPDQIAKMIADIKSESGIEFSPAGETKFNWIVSDPNSSPDDETTTDATITGLKYTARKVSADAFQKLVEYVANSYDVDFLNSAESLQAQLLGFYLPYATCSIQFNQKSGEIITDLMNLSCGFFNRNDVPKLMAEAKIRQILATKYKKAISEVLITASKYDDGFAVGSVSFGPKGTPGGLFLAVKSNNDWQVIFDSNGSVDCNLVKTKYNFPSGMLTGICD